MKSRIVRALIYLIQRQHHLGSSATYPQLFLWCVACCLISACAHVAPHKGSTEQIVVGVYFATDRDREQQDNKPHPFGNQRGELSYGHGEVVVNTAKNNRTPVSDDGAWPVHTTPPTVRNATLVKVLPLSFAGFSQHITVNRLGSTDKSALIYIHGYAKSFEESAENLARFVYEINYQGVPVLFSWPSKGAATGYSADVTTLDWSSVHLETLLTKLSEKNDIDTVHIVAHSLGNRAMLKALANVAYRQHLSNTPWRFGEIIMLAPDVDKGLFARDWAPGLSKVPSRVTLYLTAEDFPLWISGKLNQYPRLGDSRFTPLAYPGIETVDVSDVVTMLRGHSYFRKDHAVLIDLHHLINGRKSATERPNIHAVISPEGQYWRLLPTESNTRQELDQP